MQAGPAISSASADIELSHIRLEEQNLTTEAVTYSTSFSMEVVYYYYYCHWYYNPE